MRRIIKAVIVICVMSSCGSTPKEAPATTLPPIDLAPVTTQPLEAHVALQEDLVEQTTTTTEAPAVFDPAVFIDESRTVYGKCGEWHDTLIAVGGREEDWPIWSRILHTESRCLPQASNGACVGLTQIYYAVHKSWLDEFGFTKEDLLDPVKNLTFAVALQASSGWSPWAYLNMP